MLSRLLGGRPAAVVLSVGLAFAGLVGVVDYYTGFELSLSIFYLMPIGLVTWYGPRWAGFLLCGVSALVWLAADSASGHAYSYWFMPVENALVRLGFFLVTALLLNALRARLVHEATLARQDDLTRILNARAFAEVSQRLLRMADRHQHPLALAYIDIDDFKMVNDTEGHSAGDLVLQQVAATLAMSVRSTDVIGRLGGDEFGVLMPETGRAGAEVAFAKIHEALARKASDRGWPIGFSFGVALFQSAPPSVDEALKAADALMYRVKQAGKNQVLFEEQAGN